MVVGLVGAQAFVRGCLNVLIVVTAFRVLDGNQPRGRIQTVPSVWGGLVGALAASSSRGYGSPFGRHRAGLPGASDRADGVFLLPREALLLLAVVGAANSIEDVAAFTLLERIVPDDVLTRRLGALWGLAMGGVALGSIVAPRSSASSALAPPSSRWGRSSRCLRS